MLRSSRPKAVIILEQLIVRDTPTGGAVVPAEGDGAALAPVAAELDLSEGQLAHASEERGFVFGAGQLRLMAESLGKLRRGFPRAPGLSKK